MILDNDIQCIACREFCSKTMLRARHQKPFQCVKVANTLHTEVNYAPLNCFFCVSFYRREIYLLLVLVLMYLPTFFFFLFFLNDQDMRCVVAEHFK